MAETVRPTVGRIVHVVVMGRCWAALVTDVDEAGTAGLHTFPPPQAMFERADAYEAYNPLSSARPTSGWHWPREHPE